jgi:hypothetical protein
VVNEYGQLIRSAITVAGILGNCANNARTCGSTVSAFDPRAGRSYRGGRSEANAARTVFRAIPNSRAISLIDTSSARCSRRISAQSSNLITLQDSRRVVSFQTSTPAQCSPVGDSWAKHETSWNRPGTAGY